MTMHTPSATWTLHVSRSQFIDCFVEIEVSIQRLLRLNGIEPKCIFGQNIELAKLLKPSPKLSKLKKSKLDQILNQLGTFQDMRCDVVHGRMNIIQFDEGAAALFRNPQKDSILSTPARLVNDDQFKLASAELVALNQALIALCQPSQVAASPVAATQP